MKNKIEEFNFFNVKLVLIDIYNYYCTYSRMCLSLETIQIEEHEISYSRL